jgi:single-stranded-DNA-specific exonuclease
MSLKWVIKPEEKALTERLFGALGSIPEPLVGVMVQRGLSTVEQIREFVMPSLGCLRDPFELPDMDRAVKRIREAFASGENITVFGDYDADGICSTALMVRLLQALGGKVSWFIPNRMDEGYGLSPDALALCVERHSPGLIVTVDCGTNSNACVKAAHKMGIDVVVTDHHEPDDMLADEAVAIVNPKRVKNHPDSLLAGVGVAFKLGHALVKQGRRDGCPLASTLDLKDYLDFVAVATVTDMVPLTGENRILVRAGLERLETSVWAGWRALKDLSGITGSVETWHAGFAFGPRINAAGRVGKPDAALELLLTDLPKTANRLARVLDDANRERQLIERDIVREAMEEVDSYFNPEQHYGLVVAREGWHSGVVGIVASRLVQRYGRPAIVVGMEGGQGRGSCRSIESFNLLNGLSACSSLLEKFGGHAMAAGLEIRADDLDAFRKQFNAFAAQQLKDSDLRPVLTIDRRISLKDVNQDLMEGLRMVGPFGQDNPEPVWSLHNVQVSDRRILQDKHLKLTVTDGTCFCDAIGFNMAEKLPEDRVDLAFTLQENTWNGRTNLQLLLKDLRPAE